MIYFIGAGTNTGDHRANLLRARAELAHTFGGCANAPLQENPPLLPESCPESWYKPYLNTVFKVETNESPQIVLTQLKRIEALCGRTHAERWAPRALDLDILCTDKNARIQSEALTLPHASLLERTFTLNPLVHLHADLPIDNTTALRALRAGKKSSPYLMGVLNCTPDSFSNAAKEAPVLERFQDLLSLHVPMIDLGAESTRPNAAPVSPKEEIARLQPLLEVWMSIRDHHPWTQISIDTRHAETARFAHDHGVTILNDVAHLSDPALREMAPAFDHVVFMHSLTVPADPKVNVTESNVVQELHAWCETKLENLKHIPESKLIFDPGIGFNKTPVQSLRLLQNLNAFSDLPVRLLIGHSRKSFMNLWTSRTYADRDTETAAVSLALLDTPVNILRVHNVPQHQRALLSYQSMKARL